MSTKIISDSEEFEISEHTESAFLESMKKLEELLKPDTPVMVEKRTWEDNKTGDSVTKTLLFSDGKLHPENKLMPRNLGRNRVFAQIYGENNQSEDYRLVSCWLPEQDAAVLFPSRSWRALEENDGTFSPSGYTSWTSFHSARISQVMLGDKAREAFPKTLDAIKFAETSHHFTLHGFYSMPRYLVRLIGKKDEDSRKRDSEASKLACVSAVRVLVEQAGKTKWKKLGLERPYDTLHIDQIGWWKTGVENARKQSYPVEDEDFLIYELSHPSRRVCFVKTGRGCGYGDTYVLPCKESSGVVDFALSDKFVKEYFPFGAGKK